MQRLFVQLNNKPLKLIPLVLIPVLILGLVASIIPPGVARADPGWYDSDWSYRKKITLESDNVTGSSNLLYFPVSIQVTDTDLANDAKCRNDGWDILFTAGDETTKLQHEIESFDGATGDLIAWVEIPSLSYSADTEIYMYYGNNGVAISSENVTGVWDDTGYKMVQHLEETSGGTNAIIDSTANSNNGTDVNSPTFSATGQVDGAISFVGASAEYIDFGNGASIIISDNLTIEAWIYPTAGGTNQGVISKLEPSKLEYQLYLDSSNQIIFRVNHSDGFSGWITATGGTVTLNAWNHVVGVYDESNVSVYLDGTKTVGPAYASGILDLSANVAVGNYGGYASATAFTGTIDEVRLSDSARSDDWIKTSYNNQSNPGDFLDFGPEIGAPTVATTGPASSVEETSATVNGTLTDDGGEGCQYRFEYDFDTSGAPYDYSTAWSTENKTSGETFSAALSSLDEGTVYYYRAQARNNTGTVSGSELTFLTKPLEPTGFTATTASSSQINLGWTKGTGAQRTLIMRKEGSYPQNITDGDQVYFDSGESTSDSSLMPSKTYFYSAWSEVTGSTQYSDAPAQANATTSSGQPTVIGGLVLPVNKAAVLAPWLFLGMVLAVVIARVILLCVRRRRSSVHRY